MVTLRLFNFLLIFVCLEVDVECTWRFFKLKTTNKSSNNQVLGEKLRIEFKEIDGRLKERVESSNIDTNLRVAEELLRKYEESWSILSSSKKERQIEAAKLILSMQKMTEVSMCNRAGRDIDIQLSEALEQEPALKRIIEMFYHSLRQQEAVCRGVLVAVLNSKLDKIDYDKLGELDYIVEEAANMDPGDREVDKLFNAIKNNNVGPTEARLESALGVLPQLMPDESELQQCSTSEELCELILRETFGNHLIEPCKYFTEQLDIFDLATAWIPFHEPDKTQNQFYWNWFIHQFCKNTFDIFRDIPAFKETIPTRDKVILFNRKTSKIQS